MKNKKIVGGILAAAVTMAAVMPGCSLISTNSETNLGQSIADVNITLSENFEDTAKEKLADGSILDLSQYSDVITTSGISRRDLIAYFVNVGYSYVQSGYTYETTFTMLIDSLTETEQLTQYATLYLLAAIAEDSGKTASSVLEEYEAFESQYKNDYEVEIAQYTYLLRQTQEMGSAVDRVNLATYSLYSSINSSIDSYEEALIEDDDDDESGTDSRTTPDNVDTEKDDYYPVSYNDSGDVIVDSEGYEVLNYGIYTGYSGYLLEDSGEYEDDKVEGDTRTLRAYAYNQFVMSLKSNYLIGENEDCTDILSLSYIKEEYVNQLKSQVIEQYFDIYECQLEEDISSDEYLNARYNELLTQQSVTYRDADEFETALDSLASDSFVLYAPDTTETGSGTFGFVYNILLPFSQSQSNTLAYYSDLLENGTIDETEYYIQRNKLLKDITTTDQRAAWFTGTTDYSFDASETDLNYYDDGDSNRKYLFFENNLIYTDRYESLDKYIGMLTYNGTVTEADDGSYILTPTTLNIDTMLTEFTSYINFVLSENGKTDKAVLDKKNDNFFTATDFYKADDPDEIDYTKFIYAEGYIDFEEEDISKNISNLFLVNSSQYLALSAVNELQYAYTTDTSVLSQYIGYSVSAYDTSYIKEFEAAAKEAISKGAGTFYVVAGDYGWHIIYVTATYDNNGGNVYGETIDWDNEKEIEGTFAYMFYEYIKESDLSSATSNRRSQLISLFTDDNAVVLYEDVYSDLMELDD